MAGSGGDSDVSWQPLLTGAAVEPIRAAIDDIAHALSSRSTSDRTVDELADRAVLHAYLARDGIVEDRGEAGAWLMSLVDRLAAGGVGVGLHGGAARVGWTLAHLAAGDDIDATCAAIDQALAARLGDSDTHVDLVRGIVGIGVYALERGNMALASAVVDELRRRAEPRAGGRTWRARSESGNPWDLGVAHGVAGAIAFLARAAAVDIDGARELLEDAVAYLRGLAPAGTAGRFPSYESGPARSRLAWCYGDLGIAVALLGAGLLVERPAWCDDALALALACARRTFAESEVTDPVMCHGAAGNAHLFNRMAQATGHGELGDAARTWIGHTLALRGEDGIAGFVHRPHADAAGFAEQRAATLLYGASGVALVLYAAISSDEPCWDRLLLADLPVP